MSVNNRNDEHPIDDDAYYETVASQEEIYLEENEKEVSEVLASEDSSPPKGDSFIGETLDEQLADAVEELITGDADDPPLSQETIAEMLNISAAIHVLPHLLQESF